MVLNGRLTYVYSAFNLLLLIQKKIIFKENNINIDIYYQKERLKIA